MLNDIENMIGVRSQRKCLELGPEDMDGLPEKWLADFDNAIIRCDMDAMLELVDDIAVGHPVLCRRLGDLIRNFQLDKIKTAISSHKGKFMP